MTPLSKPSDTVALLKKYSFHIQKRYGQNFLVDSRVRDKILNTARVDQGDFVLEIGPGIGFLTQALAERAGKVAAVEVDGALLPILEETLSGYPQTEILCADVMQVDLKELVREKSGGRRVKVVANLPYYITTPIIMRFFEEEVPADSLTLMVQKEVALRMQAREGTKEYGALSLAVQYYARPKLAANVPPNCFFPRPQVSSAVIQLERNAVAPVQVQNKAFLFSLIRAAFNQRRKTLVNALSHALDGGAGDGCADGAGTGALSKRKVREALAEMGLPETVRGEALTLSQFAALSERLIR